MSEAFSAVASDAGSVGFVVSRLPQGKILWVQDRQSRKEAGRPYLPALPNLTLIQVDLNRPADVMWAMEEGLRCRSLCAVIGEVWGDPPALNFTATKRLALRAEKYNVPCWLIRRGASPDLSAARDRWRITSLPSDADPEDPKVPGDPRWQVDLFRSRTQRPGQWVASHDRTADRVHLSAPLRDGTLAEGDGAGRGIAAR